MIWVLLAVFLAPAVLSIAWRASTGPSHWRDASHAPTGQAPEPATMRSAIIQVYAARTWGARGGAAVHTWITAKRSDADEYERYEVIGWRLRHTGSALVRGPGIPDAEWFSSHPTLLADIRGDGVDAVIDRMEAVIDAYPYKQHYVRWPGPNSNTFTAFVARRVPELRVDLPPTAIGKDYLGNGELFAKAPSGTGYQFSAWGVLGIMAALEEGIEVNLGTMVAGIDFTSLAIKLPGVGTWPRWKRSETWIGPDTSSPETPTGYAATRANGFISRNSNDPG